MRESCCWPLVLRFPNSIRRFRQNIWSILSQCVNLCCSFSQLLRLRFPSQYPIRFSGESPPSSSPALPYPVFVSCRITDSPAGIVSSSLQPYPSDLVISSYRASSSIFSMVLRTRIKACKVFSTLSLLS